MTKKLLKEIVELRKDLNTLAKEMGFLPMVHFSKDYKNRVMSKTLKEIRINKKKMENK